MTSDVCNSERRRVRLTIDRNTLFISLLLFLFFPKLSLSSDSNNEMIQRGVSRA